MNCNSKLNYYEHYTCSHKPFFNIVYIQEKTTICMNLTKFSTEIKSHLRYNKIV